jgi:hypothetical protein
MKTIPQVREYLLKLADSINNGKATDVNYIVRQLRNAVNNMKRRPYVRKASTESKLMTPQLKRRIKAFATNNPHMTYMRIANYHGVSIGRVSEALAGKRSA